MRPARAGIKLERGFHVGALLHVNPQSFFRCGRCLSGTLDELREIRKTEFAVEIEAQLGQLHGDFRGQVHGADEIEEIEIVRGHVIGFGAFGNIFAELG